MDPFNPFFNKPKATALKARIPDRDLSSMRDTVITKAAAKRSTKPVMDDGNAQTKAYGKAMQGAFKNTKTFGIPGAK